MDVSSSIYVMIAMANQAKLQHQAIIIIGKNVAYGRSLLSDVNIKAELEKICKKVEGDAIKAKGFGLKVVE